MQAPTRDVVGGVAAGLAMTLTMSVGRRTGLLRKTLAENAEDWLDRTIGARRRFGRGGTTALEQLVHLAAAAGFGLGYGVLRRRLPRAPGLLLGPAYGAALYAVNIVGIAPLLGMTEGEQNAPAAVRAQRLGLHLLYGALTAIVADGLRRPPHVRQARAALARRGFANGAKAGLSYTPVR